MRDDPIVVGLIVMAILAVALFGAGLMVGLWIF